MNTLQLNQKIINGLQAINYQPEVALKEFIMLNLSEKLSKFNLEYNILHSKYNVDFQEFEIMINNRKNEENFEEYDDYMAWKYASDQVKFLNEQIDLLK